MPKVIMRTRLPRLVTTNDKENQNQSYLARGVFPAL